MKSIIVEDMTKCVLCGSPNVEVHHAIHGTANRKIAGQVRLNYPTVSRAPLRRTRAPPQ